MNLTSLVIIAYAQILFVLLLPALVATGCTVLWRDQINRPFVFFFVSCVALYVLYVALMSVMEPFNPSSAAIWRTDGAAPPGSMVAGSSIGRLWKFVVTFGVLAIPLVWGLLSWFSRGNE